MSSSGSTYPPYGQSCPLYSPFATTTTGVYVLEDEMFITGHCESGALRLWTLVVLLILEFALGTAAAWMLWPALFSQRRFKLTPKILILSSMSLAGYGRAIGFFQAVFYKFTGGYYFFLAFPLCLLMLAATVVVEQWFLILSRFDGATLTPTREYAKSLRVYMIGYNILFTVVLIVFWTVSSALRGDASQIDLHNILIAIGFLWASLLSVSFGFSLLFIGNRFKMTLLQSVQNLKSHVADERMNFVIVKITRFTYLCFSASLMGGSGCFVVFAWWLGTYLHGLDMRYFFFLLYYCIVPTEISGVLCLLYVMTTQKVDSNTSPTDSGVAQGKAMSSHSGNTDSNRLSGSGPLDMSPMATIDLKAQDQTDIGDGNN